MNWGWVWTTALIAAAIATYGILIRDPSPDARTAERPVQPGYYLKDAVITYTQPDGQPRMRFIASLMQQNPTDDSIVAERVRMEYLAIPEQPWIMTADQGRAPADLVNVAFSGNVVVRSDTPGRAATIRTTELTVNTRTNIASTSAPVEIEFAGNRLNATGLRADLRGERLQLQSAIHGTFERR